jgi:predicted deacylase
LDGIIWQRWAGLRRPYLIVEIVVPNLGATGGDVIIQDFLVKPGDFVHAGTPLFVVTTDKATVEIEAYRSGYLHLCWLNLAPAYRPDQSFC